MILIHFTPTGTKRIADLSHILTNTAAFLVGGAPSLRQQNIEQLNQRGVITMAINNAAVHFRPTMWVSGDHPECFEPQILLDPTIMKFAPYSYATTVVEKRRYYQMPNIYFYIQEDGVPWDEFFSDRNTVPWYSNTLFVGIHILYMLGIRRLLLAGSDFGFSKPDESQHDLKNGDMYAHATNFGDLERKWNLDLYNSQVRELRMLKPIFDKAGLELIDSSKNSRIKQTYRHVTLEEAVMMAKEHFPAKMKNPADLPHCSKFATVAIQERIAQWPGYNYVDSIFKAEADIETTTQTNQQEDEVI